MFFSAGQINQKTLMCIDGEIRPSTILGLMVYSPQHLIELMDFDQIKVHFKAENLRVLQTTVETSHVFVFWFCKVTRISHLVLFPPPKKKKKKWTICSRIILNVKLDKIQCKTNLTLKLSPSWTGPLLQNPLKWNYSWKCSRICDIIHLFDCTNWVLYSISVLICNHFYVHDDLILLSSSNIIMLVQCVNWFT